MFFPTSFLVLEPLLVEPLLVGCLVVGFFVDGLGVRGFWTLGVVVVGLGATSELNLLLILEAGSTLSLTLPRWYLGIYCGTELTGDRLTDHD